jgi:hypothetical protein
MPRPWSIGILSALILAGSLRAEELKGSIRKVDVEKETLTVSVAGKDRQLIVPDTARIYDARGAEVKERLRSRVLQGGASAKFTFVEKGGKAELDVIRLTNSYLPRPDEFYLDPKTAGPDFEVQGEYEGEIPGQGKLGAQVAAREDGQFSVEFLPGGLPGAGWDPKGKSTRVAAFTVEGNTTLTGAWSGRIADGKLSGKTDAGLPFTLTRVARMSPTLGARPPGGAVVLFDGSGTDRFLKATMSEDKLLKVPATSKALFKDFHLHVEFLIPYRGPSGGNSGVYLQNCYEIQVFDSFGGQRSPSGCGGIYVFRRPDVNAALPPLSWQTFDVDFTAARFDPDGKMVKNPVVTVRHNGVVIHDNVTLPEKGNGGRPTPQGGPLFLQAHGSPVRYRNIWLVERN